MPCVSGLHDYDYPSFLNSGLGMDIFTEIGDIRKVPLPAELVEHFGRILFYGKSQAFENLFNVLVHKSSIFISISIYIKKKCIKFKHVINC